MAIYDVLHMFGICLSRPYGDKMADNRIRCPVVFGENGVRVLKDVLERQSRLMDKNKNVLVRSDFVKKTRPLSDAR